MNETINEVMPADAQACLPVAVGHANRASGKQLDIACDTGSGRAAGVKCRRLATHSEEPVVNDNRAVVARVIAGFGFEPARVDRALAQLYEVSPSAPVADELLTGRELCQQLQVSTTTLWRLGNIPHVTIGARRRYILREVLEFLASKPRRGTASKLKV